MTDEAPAGGEGQATDGLADAMGHLQTAALSMVAAARAALDAAERLARDPSPLLEMVADATRAARTPTVHGDAGPGDASSRPPPARPRVEHISVRPPSAVSEHEVGGDGSSAADGPG